MRQPRTMIRDAANYRKTETGGVVCLHWICLHGIAWRGTLQRLQHGQQLLQPAIEHCFHGDGVVVHEAVLVIVFPSVLEHCPEVGFKLPQRRITALSSPPLHTRTHTWCRYTQAHTIPLRKASMPPSEVMHTVPDRSHARTARTSMTSSAMGRSMTV